MADEHNQEEHNQEEHNQEEDNPLQGYFDWQVTTLMLAHDLSSPILPGDEDAHRQRRSQVEDEVRTLTLGVLPEEFKHDASLQWTPELMMTITRETLRTASKIGGLA